MSQRLRYLANQVRNLTYTEMMEVARWFAFACQERNNNDALDSTFNDEDANEWAQFLNDWSESWLENNPESDDD
ncbi:hypothetical protein [Microvirga lotononidis]|uniref:Uncharacterized protein n=1 Tax=Microvirga lotononidis TaxID=864069 RepID=I4YP13_9HYPH|nr:hypothetical protein [Microvirga lotononidis]EIM25705.1 hypothetical protein MicloDRAFT_00064320 [Microvirga lotononidis]WQO25641.1 hypothetical protein U0023_13035 [Microvirga lotononidis]